MCLFNLCALITYLLHCYVKFKPKKCTWWPFNLFGQQHTLNLLTVCYGLICCVFYLLECSLKLSEDTWPRAGTQAITGSFNTDLSGNDSHYSVLSPWRSSPVTKGHYKYITVYILCTYHPVASDRAERWADHMWEGSRSASLARLCSRELWKASSHDSGIRNSSSRSQIQKIRCLHIITPWQT